ncbi:MAG: MopE-related protein [Kofleriaceae bacterium]
MWAGAHTMHRLLAPAVALTSATLLAPRLAAADDSCAPARAMVVLDKSSSMQTGSIGGVTKWNIAVQGLGQVLTAYETRAEFGLMTFPRPSQCAPGGLDVAPALGNRAAILGALTTPPPSAGNWTPMAETLEVAATEPSLLTAAGPRHVILVTDGWQWCSPYDPSTRYDGVEAVAKLQAAGITTWIVGFGAEVDAAALNQMAMVAGTERPGCDPNNTDPSAPDQCYFQVDNAAALVTALDAIAGTIVAAEICDGIDNDCDGQVDEDLVRGCSTACGSGTETCQAGSWGACTAPVPAPEVCDGDDNNCDGEVDEGDTCGPTDDGEGNGNNGAGEMQAGCACSTDGLPDAGALAPLFAVGFLVFRRRRQMR